jgi:hypothetical protein
VDNMQNKNRVFRIASLLLVLCFISTVMISGTLAKYTSEYSGQDTVLVARWELLAAAGQLEEAEAGDLVFLEESTALALFDHAYDTHINQKDGDSFILAPGVGGEFFFAVGNYSDVAADVEVKIEPLADNTTVTVEGSEYVLPVEYSVDGETWVTLDNLAETLVAAIVSNGIGCRVSAVEDKDNVFRIEEYDATVEYENADEEDEGDDLGNPAGVGIVQWRWPYEPTAVYSDSSDIIDTAFGQASAAAGTRITYGIQITVTATQVAPGIETP